jgi:integrase
MADIRKRHGARGDTYQVRYAKPDGRYAFRSFPRRRDAVDFIESLASRKRLNTAISTVADAVDIWLDVCGKEGRDGRPPVSPAVGKLYKHRATIIKSYDWDKPLQDLGKPDVVNFRSWLLRERSRDQSRKVLSSFHSVLIEMMNRGYIGHDPAAGVRIQGDATEIEVPNHVEVKQILTAADELAGHRHAQIAAAWERYRPMIYLAVASGMRPQEYVALPRRDVLENGIRVSQAMTRAGAIGPPKSRAGHRVIDVGPETIGMVREFMGESGDPDELVFGTTSGLPMRLTPFRASAWTPLMRQAGLIIPDEADGEGRPKYTPYALRHYFASRLLQANSDIKYVQAQMGHAKAALTLDTYGHLLPSVNDARAAATRSIIGDLMS